jgi:protein-S-isoprenylcysteine O-methyltransferase Ste14
MTTPWWKGRRGEWMVAAQIVLMLLVLLGPRTVPGTSAWDVPYSEIRRWPGAVFVVIGGALAGLGSLRLGSGLTPLPYPKDGAPLVRTGPYAVVRHPIYSGLLIGSAGIALLVSGWLTWVYAAALFAVFDVKTRHEERWLSSKFPEYGSYQRRVRKLLPFVY